MGDDGSAEWETSHAATEVALEMLEAIAVVGAPEFSDLSEGRISP